MTEIDATNFGTVNIEDIALNKDKKGSLIFERSLPALQRLQNFLKELIDLNYSNYLTEEENKLIESFRDQFINKLRQVEEFDVSLVPDNAKNRHDSLEQEIINLNNEVFRRLRNFLVYLRQEAAQQSKAGKNLANEQKAALNAKKEYEEISQNFKKYLDTLQQRETEIENKQGKVASKQLAKHFESQASEHKINAKEFLKRRSFFYIVILFTVSANFILYVILFVLNKLNTERMPPSDFFTYEYGVVKLALITLLWYGMNFISRNFATEAHLEAVNSHRKNVAQTLDDFLGTSPDAETKAQIVKSAASAMFEHSHIGYLKNEDQKDGTPVQEIINYFSPKKD